jgi:lipopolysaccharide transport system ATP-binding protein
MTMGQGFHPDYTGRENIHASLHYNGLSNREVDDAFEDVVEFCELGPFLGQPFKTYSSGMQSRLMFATATAIRPDILIIDEVLGAGDAYFLAKSKQRVDKIIANGCTLLLVSHSMQQVLELCDEAIWLDGGRINLTGEALTVVKAYEEALYGAMPGSGDPLAVRGQAGSKSGSGSRPKGPIINIAQTAAPTPESASPSSVESGKPQDVPSSAATRLQIPTFLPHEKRVKIPALPDQEGRTFHNTTRDGVSRWNGSKGTKIVGFGISGPGGFTDRLTSLQPAQMTIFLESEVEGEVAYTYGVAIYDLQGRPMCRFFSPPDCFKAQVGAGRRVDLLLNPNQLGPGIYVISLSIHHATTIEDANAAPRYDLLARSFEIRVELPDSLAAASAEFFHSCEWNFGTATLPAVSKSEEIPF